MSARLVLEYDGSEFAGWARQPQRRSVQGVVEEALATVLRRPVELTVAGRTDRGVHARGQVASHPGSPAPLRNLNALLPSDVAALQSEEAPDGFDARRDALSRTYRYRVLARSTPSPFEERRALWWSRPLDRGDQLVRRERREQFLEQHAHLEPGEVRSQAEVDAVAE